MALSCRSALLAHSIYSFINLVQPLRPYLLPFRIPMPDVGSRSKTGLGEPTWDLTQKQEYKSQLRLSTLSVPDRVWCNLNLLSGHNWLTLNLKHLKHCSRVVNITSSVHHVALQNAKQSHTLSQYISWESHLKSRKFHDCHRQLTQAC